jgi:hypothetical protein
VAETSVEVIRRELEVINVADAELDVADSVVTCKLRRGTEVVLGVDAEDLAGWNHCRKPERDRACSAADVEHMEAIDQMRQKEIGRHGRAPRVHASLESTDLPSHTVLQRHP